MKVFIEAVVQGFYSIANFMKDAMIPIALFFAISNISEYFSNKKKMINHFNNYLNSIDDYISDLDEDEIKKDIEKAKENIVDFKNE